MLVPSSPVLMQLCPEASGQRAVTQLKLAGAHIVISGFGPCTYRLIQRSHRPTILFRRGAHAFPLKHQNYLPHSGQFFLQIGDTVHSDVYPAVSRCHPGSRPPAVATQLTTFETSRHPGTRLLGCTSLILYQNQGPECATPSE